MTADQNRLFTNEAQKNITLYNKIDYRLIHVEKHLRKHSKINSEIFDMNIKDLQEKIGEYQLLFTQIRDRVQTLYIRDVHESASNNETTEQTGESFEDKLKNLQ